MYSTFFLVSVLLATAVVDADSQHCRARYDACNNEASDLESKIHRLDKRLEHSEDTLSQVISEFEAKIDRLERRIDEINDTKQDIDESSQDVARECDKGFAYKGSCYFIAVRSVEDKAGAGALCVRNGGGLAGILNEDHQTKVLEELKGKTEYIWTGMRYEHSTRTIRLHNGRQIAASSLRWSGDRLPYYADTGIKIYSGGLFNRAESEIALGGLCVN